MTEEPKYPIYALSICWLQDGQDDRKGRWYPFPPPEGRMWNATQPTWMYREDPGEDEVRRYALEEWWPRYAEEKEFPNPSDVQIRTLERYEETWCLSWFEHWTFDVGQTDEEALASFERYVRRYEDMRDYYPGEMPDGYRCLMGAEDRWRWHGAGETGARDERTDPPCRCKHCKEQGKIRIGH